MSTLAAEAPSCISQWAQRQQTTSRAAAEAMRRYGRAQIHWFCGTGKTRLGVQAARAADARRICVAAPSLALVHGQMQTWRSEWPDLPMRAFCSDLPLEDDELVSGLNRDEVREFLALPAHAIFTTYHSLGELGRLAEAGFDLLVMDEAHSTCGKRGRAFGAGLAPDFPAANRLSLTATPKYLGSEEAAEDYSMEDVALYGPVVDKFPYREAQRMGLLCDYRVLIADLGESSAADEDQRLWRMASELLAVMREHGLARAISSHSRVLDAQAFQRILRRLDPTLRVCHVNGEMSAAQQLREIATFRHAGKAVITNVQCLSQGIDVPSVDLVFFADPKHTDIGIIQTIGRALRRDPDNPGKVAFVALPMHGYSAPEYAKLRHVLRTLTFADVRVAEWLERHHGSAAPVVDEDMPAWIRVRSKDAEKWVKLLSRKRRRTSFIESLNLEAFAQAVRIHLQTGSRFRSSDGPDNRRAWSSLVEDAECSFPRPVTESRLLEALSRVPEAAAPLGLNPDEAMRVGMSARGFCFDSLSRKTGIDRLRLIQIAFYPRKKISLLEYDLLRRALHVPGLRQRVLDQSPPIGPKATDGEVNLWQKAMVEAYGATVLSRDFSTTSAREDLVRAVTEGGLARVVLAQAQAHWLLRYLQAGNIPMRDWIRRDQSPHRLTRLCLDEASFHAVLGGLPSVRGFREPMPMLEPEWIPGGLADMVANEDVTESSASIPDETLTVDSARSAAWELMRNVLSDALDRGVRGAWELSAIRAVLAGDDGLIVRTIGARGAALPAEWPRQALPPLLLASLGHHPDRWNAVRLQAATAFMAGLEACTEFVQRYGGEAPRGRAGAEAIRQLADHIDEEGLSRQAAMTGAGAALNEGTFADLVSRRCTAMAHLLDWCDGRLDFGYRLPQASTLQSDNLTAAALARPFRAESYPVLPGTCRSANRSMTFGLGDPRETRVWSETSTVMAGNVELEFSGTVRVLSEASTRRLLYDRGLVFNFIHSGSSWYLARDAGLGEETWLAFSRARQSRLRVRVRLYWDKPLSAIARPDWRGENLPSE